LTAEAAVPNCVLEKEFVSRLTSILIKPLKHDYEISTKMTITTDFKTGNQKCYRMDYKQICVRILNASPTLMMKTASLIHYDKASPTIDVELMNVRS
jgi:hypothetical protein